MNGKVLVGHDNGRICTVDVNGNEHTTQNVSHHDGEAWGLEVISKKGTFLTSADDNEFHEYSIRNKKHIRSGKIWTKEMNGGNAYETKKIKSTASTLSDYPPHQQGRAIAYSSHHSHVAVSNNHGDIFIYDYNDFSVRIATLLHPREWCEVMKYSPDGKFLAVGAHDDTVYIYSVSQKGDYALHTKFEYIHSSAITAMDWTLDSVYMRVIDQAYGKQFYDIIKSEPVDDDVGNLTDTTLWSSLTCKLGWEVAGVFPIGTDGTDVNSVDINSNQSLIAAADDFGSLNVYRFPCVKNTQDCRRIGGHSEHVTRVKFYENSDDKSNECIITAGGMDRTYIQWKAVAVPPKDSDKQIL